MLSPFRARPIYLTIPRASLRCALGWYAAAPSVLKSPIIISGERLAQRRYSVRCSRLIGSLYSPSLRIFSTMSDVPVNSPFL